MKKGIIIIMMIVALLFATGTGFARGNSGDKDKERNR